MSVYGRADFAAEADVSHETLAAFDAWYALLKKWNRTINLVSPAAMSEFWERHALDCWQVVAHMPKSAKSAVDLGSGAGFPGIALGMAMADRGAGDVLLVESAGKKANFLRTLVRELKLPIAVSSERAESLPAKPHDVVSARAFAPLPKLLDYAEPFWGPETVGIFLKGAGAEAEIEEARTHFAFDVQAHASRTSGGGKVLVMTGLSRLETAG